MVAASAWVQGESLAHSAVGDEFQQQDHLADDPLAHHVDGHAVFATHTRVQNVMSLHIRNMQGGGLGSDNHVPHALLYHNYDNGVGQIYLLSSDLHEVAASSSDYCHEVGFRVAALETVVAPLEQGASVT